MTSRRDFFRKSILLAGAAALPDLKIRDEDPQPGTVATTSSATTIGKLP